LELLVSLDKLSVLVQELITIEASSPKAAVRLPVLLPQQLPFALLLRLSSQLLLLPSHPRNQAWKEYAYPHLEQHLASCVDSSTAYLVLYHEVAVANLLEVQR
jgi:hypothetical protein